jgi:cell pole-organizing protein PopZ
MQSREPSMEDILASIKRVIAEEKELRAAVPPAPATPGDDEDILELDETMAEHETVAPPAELGPPLLDEDAADTTRGKLEELSSLAASTPPPQPQGNPLEEMLREMLRPMLKQWLDDNLPRMVDEHVKREISRITGRPL